MKIAFAIEHFNPRQGGAERYAWGLARWLVERGHSLDVYTMTRPDALTGEVVVHVLKIPSRPRWKKPARFAAALTQALHDAHYDVVHGFNHARPCDVLRLGGGVHLAFEEYNALSAGSAAGRFGRALSYRLLPWYRALRANERHQFHDPRRHFIAISQRVADDMARFYPSSKGRIHVIRNGVDLAEFHPDRLAALRSAARARLNLPNGTLGLLFAANNFRLKGLPDLIRALPLAVERGLPPTRLLIVGRGRIRAFQNTARRPTVQEWITFCGPADNLLEYYAASDVLLHPTYYDACSNVCLEAMASGLPVLTSTNNGASEVMEDGKGCVLVTMPATPDELADAILRVTDPRFLAAAGPQQVKQAQKIPQEENYREVERLYKAVSSRKR